MKLLVSVSDADEARAALRGGADIIDAKDPSRGALGAVDPAVFEKICAEVGSRRFVTAALGDAHDVSAIEQLTRGLVMRGAGLVKVGFAGVSDVCCVEESIARVVRACSSVDGDAGVVAVVYADANGESVDGMRLVSVAARAGARGVLADTAIKSGPGLLALWSPSVLTAWVAQVHAHGLIAAVAGKLGARDLTVVSDAGADVAGVRGAACAGGRGGRVVAERVRALRSE